MSDTLDLSKLHEADEKPYWAPVNVRLDRTLADARERGMTPTWWEMPAPFLAEMERHEGRPFREYAGLPVTAYDGAQVILYCDRGSVTYDLLDWGPRPEGLGEDDE